MKKIWNTVREKLYTSYPNKVEWWMLGIICMIMFGTLFYSDNLVIFTTHFNEMERLFSGESLSALGSRSLPYGLLHQWICELWVLPINILHHLVGIEINDTIAILWCKALIPLFVFGCIKEMISIAGTLGIEKDDIKWMVFLFSSTVLVTLVVCHVAQTDALYLLFILKGFSALMKGDRKGFLLWFAVAIPLKIYTLFIFLPLVFLEEKRIFYIVRNILIGCIFFPIQQFWYRIVVILNEKLVPLMIKEVEVSQSEAVEALLATTDVKFIPRILIKSQTTTESVLERFYEQVLERIFHFNLTIMREESVTSVLVILFGLVCIWCYMQKREETQEWRKKCLWGVTAAYMLFFSMTTPAPYWIIVLYPFLFLLLYVNVDKLRLNLLLEKVYTFSTFLIFLIETYWVYGGAISFDNLLMGRWGIIKDNHEMMGSPNMREYLILLGVDEFMPMITAICLAATIGLLWVNHPNTKYTEDLTKEYKVKLHHGFAIFNVGFLIYWFIINVMLIAWF